MNEPSTDTITATMTSLVYGGDAMGRLPDGRAVFAPFCLPGEKVVLRALKSKRGYMRGELLEVLEPSPQRIKPRCAHYGVCGGCHYQHMPYETQLEAKTSILREQLQRLALLENPTIEPGVPSPQAWLYRNYIQFHLSQQGELGFLRPNSEEVLAIQECHLPETTLNTVWPLLDFEAIPGLERVGLRLGCEQDIQLILESSDPQPPEIHVEGLPVSVVHHSEMGELVLVGSQAVWIEVMGRSFQVSAGSFFQVNTRMAEAMLQHLLDTLPRYQSLGPDTVLLEVYCGVGLFSAFLAPLVGRLIGVESSTSAADDFSANLDEFDHVELYEAPAEVVLPNLGVHPHVLLLDPPRSGIGRAAMDGLLRLGAGTLVYISCDAATLARDARRLIAGGYRLEGITLLDLFPQTYHIESISFWKRHP